MNLREAKIKISMIAAGHGYKSLNVQNWSMSFQKGEGDERIVVNVYWSKKQQFSNHPIFTVQTALKHPKKGRKQYNRIGVDLEIVEMIFSHPRLHSKQLGVKGYFKKK